MCQEVPPGHKVGEKPAGGDEVPDRTQAIAAVYGALYSRYQGNVDLQWKLPALILTAQSFLIAASVQSLGKPFVSLTLSLLIFGIGVGSLGIFRRVELLAFLDRPMLDRYEEILLSDTVAPPLCHGSKTGSREEQFKKALGDRYEDYLQHSGSTGFVSRIAPSRWWVRLQIAISVGGAALPLLALIRL